MRTKIATIVALASFLALAALGAGIAGADPLARKRAGRAYLAAPTAAPVSPGRRPAPTGSTTTATA